MPLTVSLLPALSDNYMFLLVDELGASRTVIDPAEAAPVVEALEGEALTAILLTHHHSDHIDGVEELVATYGCKVFGGAEDAAAGLLPPLDHALHEGDTVNVGATATVLATPGHTAGHISYHFEDEGLLFCGDTLFAGGCGRLFGNPPQMMFNSLQELKRLPPHTRVYCGHEYTESNLAFAAHVMPENAAIRARLEQVRALRAAGRPTLPSTLAEELETNPFLLAATVDEFARLRQAKDRF